MVSLKWGYDKNSHFVVLVKPDPPYDLNWTLLNVSSTGTYFDIMLSWKPPQSADVETGWMTLQYEVQYREINSSRWEAVGVSEVLFQYKNMREMHYTFVLCVLDIHFKVCKKIKFSIIRTPWISSCMFILSFQREM